MASKLQYFVKIPFWLLTSS